MGSGLSLLLFNLREKHTHYPNNVLGELYGWPVEE
jgi:hypothetical protein